MTGVLRIGLAGLGTVGGGVARLLRARGPALSARAGRRLVLSAVSARNRDKLRNVPLDGLTWEDDAIALAARADVDVVVELVGGENGVAKNLVERSLRNRKHVVTANKALLARHGAALSRLAEQNGVALKFEAAVAGGIPIVKALRESMLAHEVTAVRGILNGTCNFILTEMEKTGRPFPDILAEAQKLGLAEADPDLDIGGVDTAHKIALLASLAFGTVPALDAVRVKGIQSMMPDDIAFAREFGYRIKLLGIARRRDDGIEQRVYPAMVRAGTPLADVEGSFNAVVVDVSEAGPFFFEGRGAGEGPTASAVIADLVDVARQNTGPVFGRPAVELSKPTQAPPDAHTSPYCLRFQVLDAPGVMAEISHKLASEGISIESMIQRGRAPGEPVAIVMITHETAEGTVRRALQAIAASDKVFERPSMIPMEAV
ncbi:MAG: homoserine dehydrogenase [Alphaproteobacteria bacterium]